MSESDGTDPRKRIVLYLILLFFVAGLFALLFRGPENEAPQEDFDYIAAKADELDHDPDRILEFVAKEIGEQDYEGVLKGAVGTLFSGAGNDEDRASLLVALLRASEIEARFARSESTWVQMHNGDDWENLLETPGKPTWTGESLESDRYHHLTVALRRSHQEGLLQRALDLRPADLAPHPVILSFEGNEAILSVPGQDAEARVELDGSPGETLSLVFSHRAPNQEKAYQVSREIFTRRYSDEFVRFDKRDRHLIAVAPWSLPAWVYQKELELLDEGSRKFSDDQSGNAYRLALSCLKKSDEATKAIADHFQTSCYFKHPRLIISSVHFDQNSKGATSIALDLRENNIFIEGDLSARSSVGVTRSTYEASLEAALVSQISGRPPVSAFPILQQLFDRRLPSTPERLRLYASSLERMLKEARPGAEVTFRTSDQHALTIRLLSDSKLQITDITPELAKALHAWPGDWKHIKKEGEIARSAIGTTALELELLFGPALKSNVDYRPLVEYADSLQELVGLGTRIFRLRTNEEGELETTLEYQFQQVDGDVRYESIDYYDEFDKKPIRLADSYTIPQKSVESSHLLSHFYSDLVYGQGGMFLFASREVLAELKAKGETIIRYIDNNGKKSDEIKLFVTDRAEREITVNNRIRKVPIIYAAGSYLKDNPTKKPWAEVEVIKLPPPLEYATNKWGILDNEHFPLIGIAGSKFQTAIPGRITSANSGLGIPDVRVTVEGTGSQGTTWADGRLILPVVKKAFATFEVTASHPGYEPLRTSIDFTKPDAFPLNLTLTPRPNPGDFVWVKESDLDTVLPTVETSDRARDFIRTALTERPRLLALVPKRRPVFGGSDSHAWILFDPDHLQFVGVTEDGLHGSSMVGGMTKDWAKNAAAQAGLGQGTPYDMQTGAINSFAGYTASWYAYSAGKLNAVTQMMGGTEFDDVGHASAMKFALDFLKGMQALNKGAGGFAGQVVGYRKEQFEAGFMEGLKFFESNPVFRGQ